MIGALMWILSGVLIFVFHDRLFSDEDLPVPEDAKEMFYNNYYIILIIMALLGPLNLGMMLFAFIKGDDEDN